MILTESPDIVFQTETNFIIILVTTNAASRGKFHNGHVKNILYL